jgi:hypothetical protein
MFKKLMRRVQEASPKQLFIASAFMVAMAGAISLGLASKQLTHAATIRECTTNSIDYMDENGGCGAANPTEYIQDMRTNKPSDLQTIAKNFTSEFNLQVSQYDDFAANAREGIAYKNGTVVVDGQTVLTDAWSIGRQTKGYSTTMVIPGAGTFHKSRSQDVFAVNSIPVMVYFNADGSVRFIAMNPCGNLMGGNQVPSTATCKALNASQTDKTNPNHWTFTTSATFTGNASLNKVVYTFSDDNTSVTETSLSTPVDHIFKKAGTVTVKVYANVPGGHVITASVVNCSKQIAYVPPMVACVNLEATALDEQKTSFRFTAIAKMDKYSKLNSVDFTLDANQVTAGVTTKDANGNIYKDYSFTDYNTHKVVAKLNFTTFNGVTSVTCQASVTPTKPPMCTVPGLENLPPNSPECAYCTVPGYTNLPANSPQCQTPPPTTVTTTSTPPTLPNTGAGDVLGLFTGTSAFGAVAHRMFASRRRKMI